MTLFDMIGGGRVSVSDMRRITYIRRGLSQFLKSPFWGNGMNYSEFMFGTYSHNNYVEMLLNFGIIGFCIHYYSHFISARKALTDKTDRKTNLLFMSVITAILVTDIGVVTYYDRNIAIIMGLMSKYYSDLLPDKLKRMEEGEE